jgi:hypothetical protein
MKIKKLRAILGSVADMQRNLGDEPTSRFLQALGDVLRPRDKEDVAKVIESIQQRRKERCTS